MTRKVARAAPAGKRWGGSGGQGREQEVSGRWRKGCRDQFLEHSGPVSGTFGTAAPYGRPRFGSAQATMGGPTGFRT